MNNFNLNQDEINAVAKTESGQTSQIPTSPQAPRHIIEKEAFLDFVALLQRDKALRDGFMQLVTNDGQTSPAPAQNKPAPPVSPDSPDTKAPANTLFQENIALSAAVPDVAGAGDSLAGFSPAFSSALSRFEAGNPGYFTSTPVRAQFKNYLVKNCSHLELGELEAILSLAKELENSAIMAFKAQKEFEKSLANSNELAKSKLCANALSSGQNSATNTANPFTRKQISAMTLNEFKDNEKEIFSQYRKGLIK